MRLQTPGARVKETYPHSLPVRVNPDDIVQWIPGCREASSLPGETSSADADAVTNANALTSASPTPAWIFRRVFICICLCDRGPTCTVQRSRRRRAPDSLQRRCPGRPSPRGTVREREEDVSPLDDRAGA